MRKPLLKVLLPITALLLSACTNPFDMFRRKEQQEEQQQQQEEEQEIKWDSDNPQSIEIPSTLPMTVGQTKSLSVSFAPITTKNKGVTWTSDNASIATVNENGVITAVGVGTTKIKAHANDQRFLEITSECTVFVTDSSAITKQPLKYTYEDYNENAIYPFDNCPLEGNPKLLVVPVWFSDSTDFIAMENREDVRDDIRKTFLGTNEETGWRSVKSYYEEESKGIIEMGGTITEWYDTGKSYLDFAPSGVGGGLTENLVSAAPDWYFENHPEESRQDYDSNGDGYLDSVILVYGAPEQQSLALENAGNLWAYTSWLMSFMPSVSNPVPNVFFWGSYDFMYSSGVDAYSRTGIASYGRGDTRYCNIDAHCYIHEMGHVLGLADYYDYNGQASPAAGFSMQDMNVGGHDPYSLLTYGWADPIIPTETMTINLNDFQSSHDVILLANHEVTSPFDEYILIELYAPTGLNQFDAEHAYNYYYPKGPMETGIRVWHVDARLTYINGSSLSESLITDPTHGDVYHAFNNNSYKAGGSDASYIGYGSKYAAYNELQLIRQTGENYYLTSNSLFKAGSTFDQSEFAEQFPKRQRMNDGNYLGWTFKVEALDATDATITVTKIN